MNDLYGYIFISLMIILLAVFFFVYLYFERRKIYKTIENEKKRILIVNDATTVALFVKRKQDDLERFPILKKYLEQVFYIFEKDIYSFNTIYIVEKKYDSKDCSKAYYEAFFNEYKKAPRNIRKHVTILGDTIMQIYEFKNPKEYSKLKRKTRIFCFFGKYISMIINFCNPKKLVYPDKNYNEKNDLCLQSS